MRIRDLRVADAPPVRLFDVSGLADTVVVAGPNGVAKTRLIGRVVAHLRSATPDASVAGVIEATSRDELDAWNKRELDMASPHDPFDVSTHRG